MIKNKRAQVMLLDVLFAIVLITLLLFLLFKVSETKIYSINSSKEINELESVGGLAFNKLTDNSFVNCKVLDSQNNILIKNSFYPDSKISKENLGLGPEYNCYFEIVGFQLANNSCNNSDYSLSNNYYAISFQTITYDSNEVPKSIYINNILDDDDTLQKRNAKLVVWKWEKDI